MTSLGNLFVNCANKTGVQVQWGTEFSACLYLLTGRSSLDRTWGLGGCFLLFLIRTVFSRVAVAV